MANSAKIKSILQVGTTLLIIGSVLFACEKSEISPSESSSTAARTAVSMDTTVTEKDSSCHKGDTTRHHPGHGFPGDSTHHPHGDSTHHQDTIRWPFPHGGIPHDSIPHDSTHHHHKH